MQVKWARTANKIGIWLLVLTVACGAVCSCGDRAAPPAPADSGSGEVAFSFRLSKLAVATMTRAEVVITGTDMEEIRQDLTVSADTVSGTVRGIPAGTARVFTINGYDAGGSLVYTGSATAEVLAGQQVTVRIALRETGEAEPAKEIAADLPGGVTMEFVWIEPGTFMMGSPSSEPDRNADEGPQHQVTITKGFYLGKYEITQEQWVAAMGTAPWSGQAYIQDVPINPAVYISWLDVQNLVHRLNLAAGDSLYRLPTEAEWEYACRAGTTTRWSFGDDESLLSDYAWYTDSANFSAQGVGTRLPNPWGIFDIHGNVSEWVQDWYTLYLSVRQTDPLGPLAGSSRVQRGGHFMSDAKSIRSAYRSPLPPDWRDMLTGARLVRVK